MLTPTNRPPWQEDEEPWYRQFWPWFLIALPGSVVIAAFYTLYIAHLYSDDLVVDDYYKDGLAINVQLERQQNADALGLEATLLILDRRVQARINGGPAPASLSLRLSHPLEADRDFAVVLERVAPGFYDAQLPDIVGENWHWRIDSAAGDWRIDGSLDAGNFMRGDLGS